MLTGLRFPRLPRPPAVLTLPALHGLQHLLNRLFAPSIEDGDLDFLKGRALQVTVTGISVSFFIELYRSRLLVTHGPTTADLQIIGGIYEFLVLASRREDADTLFFQRRIKLEGDTELGLNVKNFLDGLDLSEDPMFGRIEKNLNRAVGALGWLRQREARAG